MRTRIQQIVEHHWAERLPALLRELDETARQLRNILVLEEHYRGSGREEGRLQSSLGAFASESVDVRALSAVLHQSYESRVIEKARYRTIRELFEAIERVRRAYRRRPPACRFAELAEGPGVLGEAFDAHMDGLAETFRLLRVARLEARGKYDPEVHDEVFRAFNWRYLDAAEMALCPPFVVFSPHREHTGGFLGSLLEVVNSGRPVKVVVPESELGSGRPETGRAAALKSPTDITLLFLALRNVYYVQSSLAGEVPLAERIHAGLHSPRPAVFSVLDHAPGAEAGGDEEALRVRGSRALRSRAFPHFVYDPDRSPDFVFCLDLSENPEPEAMWLSEPLVAEGEASGDEPVQERPFTFADFAAGEPGYRGQLGPLTDEAGAVPLADYLELTAAERRGRTPFIHALDAERRPVRLVPSAALVAETVDRLRLWHTLQELGGIRNPFVMAAERRLQQELTAEKERSLDQQRAQLEGSLREREREAVAAAMKTLAQRLTGLGGAELPAAAPGVAPAAATVPPEAPAADAAAPPEPPPAEAPAAAEPVSELPWIDERLCTTCDDCITINKKIFAYNADKKAYIKDPRGGPYRDLVKAAEKCASGAIHPGLPQDPDEKDLDKWIKRAEPFQ